MSLENIFALIFTLLIYLIMALSFFGWGRALLNLLQPRTLELTNPLLQTGHRKDRGSLNFDKTTQEYEINQSKTVSIWIGWALSILLFQIIHLFLPINIYTTTPIFVIGIVLALTIYRDDIYTLSWLKMRWIAITILLGIAIWISLHAMLTPTNYDTGLYHLNSIRWTNTYPIVPGLGNLHGRLAFNQSFFSYVAALNFFPYFNHGRSLANSFLFLLTFATIFEVLKPYFKQMPLMEKTHPYAYLPSIFIIPVLLYIALTNNGLASPTPDLTSTLLQLIIFIYLALAISQWQEERRVSYSNILFITILSTTAITVKLSNIIFVITIYAIILLYLAYTRQLKTRVMLYLLLPTVFILSIFILRGIILSGVPLYPSTLGYGLLPIDWLMQKERIIDEANWVYSWARNPGPHWSHVLGNWDWFKPWREELYKNHFLEFVYPLSISLIMLVTLFIGRIFRNITKLQFSEIVIIFPILFSLLFWFFTAPGLRFLNALLFLFLITAFMLLFTSVRHHLSGKKFYVAIILGLIICNISYYKYTRIHHEGLKIAKKSWELPKSVPLIKSVTYSGLEVYGPKNGDQCWDSKLPCTPFFNKLLKLRVKGDLSSGFMINKKDH